MISGPLPGCSRSSRFAECSGVAAVPCCSLLPVGMALSTCLKLSVVHRPQAAPAGSVLLQDPEPALAILCSCQTQACSYQPLVLASLVPALCSLRCAVSQPGGPLPADIRSSARRKRYLPWHQRILRVTRTHFRSMLLTYLADFLVTTGIDTVRWGTAHACSHADSLRRCLFSHLLVCLLLGAGPRPLKQQNALCHLVSQQSCALGCGNRLSQWQ